MRNPRPGAKERMHCKKCGEPTTQRYDISPKTSKLEWICLCCESEKFRTKQELTRIKNNRKGWKVPLG